MSDYAPSKVAQAWYLEDHKNNVDVEQTAFLMPYARDEKFVDRHPIFKKLDKILCRKGKHNRAALVGLGGTGKTGIAIEYVYRAHEDFPKLAVFWVHAATKARFTKSFGEIAMILDLPGRDDPKIDVLSLVQTWLKSSNNRPWLIVLDNADDSELFSTVGDGTVEQSSTDTHSEFDLSEYLPQSLNGSLLVTSRNRAIGRDLCESVIEVPRMSMSEGRTLVESILEAGSSSEYLDELLEVLEYLPPCHHSSGSLHQY